MIEFLKILIDAIGKLIPVSDIIHQRRQDELAIIGLDLFDLYNSTLEVVSGGFRILNSLGDAVNVHDDYYLIAQKYRDTYREKAIAAVGSLSVNLTKQTTNLD
jgi:hypothetical protein